MPRWLELSLTAVVAIVAGLAAVALYLNLPPLGLAIRIAAGVSLFLAAGAAIGALNPRGRAWTAAVLTAWSSVLLGSIGLGVALSAPQPGDLPLALAMLTLPALLALLGGRVGAVARRRGSRGRAP